MKILIIGLGSIGQRHLRILRKIFKKKLTIYTFHTSKNNLVINDNFNTKKVKSLINYYNIKKIFLKDVERLNIKDAFICNPPNIHLKTAFQLIKFDCNLLIEKPVSTENELSKIKKLIAASRKRRLTITVGYQFRYHPATKLIKDIIQKNSLGKILNGYFHYGEYTGNTKKYEKFSDSIYVKRKNGGGSLLSFSHHIDLAHYLFGDLKNQYSFLKNSKNYKIDVEDICYLVLKNKTNNQFLFNLNFLETPANNFIILNFKLGSIKIDFIKNIATISKTKKIKPRVINFSNFERNQMYEAQSREFFSNIKQKNYKNELLRDSLKIMKLIKHAKNN